MTRSSQIPFQKLSRMPAPTYRLRPQGDRCLSIDFGDEISTEIGLLCLSAAATLGQAQLQGVTDIVPSYTAVALFYIPGVEFGGTDFPTLCAQVDQQLKAGWLQATTSARQVDIPVCYGGKHGPDLSEVAKKIGATEQEVIRLHTSPGSMVFGLGFSPGHPYIGVHDPLFALPRRDVPRTAVPAGSVAIANRQSTIYPTLLPGGWHILGATPLKLFDLNRSQPSLLLPGDQVRFIPISEQEFDRLAAVRTQEVA
ncbi:5-oxoprolinase subunit PxpB [Zwartia sp.]|uniref:5-oxoprolinase subunit PxpB n=1 Tax=Zwartia sp. TaxID=2978004 RepID=UPI00272253F6|nr:5-oxoprolinase subunit PxpB [Zwartia sp.]MDO9025617.1 5-oxoprolinase subunit PxpB [Zwartia sp.]